MSEEVAISKKKVYLSLDQKFDLLDFVRKSKGWIISDKPTMEEFIAAAKKATKISAEIDAKILKKFFKKVGIDKEVNWFMKPRKLIVRNNNNGMLFGSYDETNINAQLQMIDDKVKLATSKLEAVIENFPVSVSPNIEKKIEEHNDLINKLSQDINSLRDNLNYILTELTSKS